MGAEMFWERAPSMSNDRVPGKEIWAGLIVHVVSLRASLLLPQLPHELEKAVTVY